MEMRHSSSRVAWRCSRPGRNPNSRLISKLRSNPLETFDPEIDGYSTLDFEIENLDSALQWGSGDAVVRPKIAKADKEVSYSF
ncbi:hypothetical protein LMTR13_24970 [Bradyrhizobium icense]|uniref:Uncharacterized protein n=1 Tax=Bradyrhizobium icense TaxID=1274631 RepID=A0A1B1UJF8_9BRAD|nr:hypothetical protein LMTR13_24970 [Bradyrhizobium icense]